MNVPILEVCVMRAFNATNRKSELEAKAPFIESTRLIIKFRLLKFGWKFAIISVYEVGIIGTESEAEEVVGTPNHAVRSVNLR